MAPTHTAFGAGKVILLGEHSVVYGHPALAGPLSVGVTARAEPARAPRLVLPDGLAAPQRQLLQRAFARASEACGAPPVKVTLEPGLPLSMGLGSSAALSVAVVRVLLAAAGRRAAPADVAHAAWLMEQEFHGTPSGVDHTTSAYGALLLYRRRPAAPRARVRALACPSPLHVLVALAGERSPTKATVAALRERQARWPQRYGRIFREMGALAAEGADAVEQGDLAQLGDLMNMNHGLLASLGLSSAPLDAMVHRLRALGALGAKLTGAGGDGGAVIGLFDAPPTAALAALGRARVSAFASPLGGSTT